VPALVYAAAGNPAFFRFTLPGIPALAGVRATLQGASLEVGACFRATDGLVLEVRP